MMRRTGGRVGPYRIESLLGAGGMGTVYRAWDERLKRRVALKQIRPEIEADDTARQRFRREAQAVARLSHPAVVQVYDIVESEEADWIVLELVEGTSLKELTDQGLSLDDTLSLGREISEGLAQAHEKGIVHRDLKTENVLVTRDGHAKILDFGLARESEPDAASLTGEGRLLGTYRAMSPEQARGRNVDYRSDLFSLGTLLFEMATGVSPFAGSTTRGTLTRIVVHHPKSAREVDPEVPPELSHLIDRLLRKDPAHRPASAREVAAVLESVARDLPSSSTAAAETLPAERLPFAEETTFADSKGSAPVGLRLPPPAVLVVLAFLLGLALTSGIVFLGPGNSKTAEPRYVATTRPRVLTDAELPGLELVPDGVRVALLRGLVSLEGIAALAPERVDAVAGMPREVAREVAADEVLTSELSCQASACDLTLSRVASADERVLWTDTFEVPIDDLGLLAHAVTAYVRRAYADHRWREGVPEPEIAGPEYAAFLHLRRDFLNRQRSLPEVLADLAALRRRTPHFLNVFLLEAQVARHRFTETHDQEDLGRASRVLGQAMDIAPGHPELLAEELRIARASGDSEKATAALEALEALTPGDTRVRVSRAWWLESRGETAEALALMRQAARRRPASDLLQDLANLEVQHGDTPAARRTLNELLERSPGNLHGQRLLAQIELRSGDLERAVELYAELARRSPGPNQLSNLGFAQLLLGHYEHAVQSFTAAFEQAPRHPFLALNLADAHLLTGEKEQAEELYRRVLSLLDEYPAAQDWQFLSVRAQAQAHLGLRRQAVASIRSALELAADKPQAAYEAALVYVLVDDRAAALVEAERALRQGIEPRWFDLSWFDSLREEPTLRELGQSKSAEG